MSVIDKQNIYSQLEIKKGHFINMISNIILNCFECESKASIISLYKCYYCKKYFCDDCSKEHFGRM